MIGIELNTYYVFISIDVILYIIYMSMSMSIIYYK